MSEPATELEQAAAELQAAARRFLSLLASDRSVDLNFVERCAESFDLAVRVNISPQRGVTVIARDVHGTTEQTFCRGERVGIVAPSALRR